jgi:hypothetical protein
MAEWRREGDRQRDGLLIVLTTVAAGVDCDGGSSTWDLEDTKTSAPSLTPWTLPDDQPDQAIYFDSIALPDWTYLVKCSHNSP